MASAAAGNAADNGRSMARAGAAWTALAVLIVACVFVLNYRFILAHFSNGPYLQDSGWTAYFLGSGDFLTHYPPALGGDTYFNVHIYVYAGLIGLVMHSLGVDGAVAFAVHQGVMFGLVTACLFWLALRSGTRPGSSLLALAAGIFALIGNILWGIATYPHLEIATPALSLLGAILILEGLGAPALLAFAVTCLVREDGGLYAAFFILATLVVSRPFPTSLGTVLAEKWVWVAAFCVLYSAAMFVIRAVYFPNGSVFAADFSGDGWKHLTLAFVAARIVGVVTQLTFLVTLVTMAVLLRWSWRYAAFFVLALPLFTIQLIAVREQLGNFSLYYAIPWLLVWAGFFMVAALRLRTGEFTRPEGAILLVAAVLSSTLLLSLVGLPSSGFGISQAIGAPIVDLGALRADVAAAIDREPKTCASQSVAALAPTLFLPEQVISGPTDPGVGCRQVLGFPGDLFSADTAKVAEAAGLVQQPNLIGDRIVAYSAAGP